MNFLHVLIVWVCLCLFVYWWAMKGAPEEGDNE